MVIKAAEVKKMHETQESSMIRFQWPCSIGAIHLARMTVLNSQQLRPVQWGGWFEPSTAKACNQFSVPGLHTLGQGSTQHSWL